MYCIYGINHIDINKIYPVNYHALIDTHDAGLKYLFYWFSPSAPLLFFCSRDFSLMSTIQNTRSAMEAVYEMFWPNVLWRLTTPVLLVQKSCFRSRIIDETLMFNYTQRLVISSLYRRVSTSGPLYWGYSVKISSTVWSNCHHKVIASLQAIFMV